MNNHRRKLEKLTEAVPGQKRDPELDRELMRGMLELKRNRPDLITMDEDGEGFTVDAGVLMEDALHVRLEGVNMEWLR